MQTAEQTCIRLAGVTGRLPQRPERIGLAKYRESRLIRGQVSESRNLMSVRAAGVNPAWGTRNARLAAWSVRSACSEKSQTRGVQPAGEALAYTPQGQPMHTGSPAGRTAVVEERTGQSGPAAEAPQTGDGLSQGQPARDRPSLAFLPMTAHAIYRSTKLAPGALWRRV
jgi:hypothetical protein